MGFRSTVCGMASVLLVACQAGVGVGPGELPDTSASDVDSQSTEPEGDGDIQPGHDGPSSAEDVAEECWRYELPHVDGARFGVNSWLAAAEGRIYFHSRTGDLLPKVTHLNAIDADGQLLWYAETWQMSHPLPPIVDQNGDILLVAQSVDDYVGQPNGVRIQKFSRDGRELWRMLGDATVADPIYGVRQLRSSAAAIDENGHLYVTVGSYLKSFDSRDGHLRWQSNIVQEGLVTASAIHGSPTVVDNRVIIIDASQGLVVFDTDGGRVTEVPGLFSDLPPSWVTATRAGFLVVTRSGWRLTRFTPSGEVLGHADLIEYASPRIVVAMDDEGNIYGQSSEGYLINKLNAQLDLIWQSDEWLTAVHTGMIVATDGRNGFLGASDVPQRFLIFDRTTGEQVFHRRLGPRVDLQPVMVRSGEIIVMAMRDTTTGSAPILCFKAPLGLPDADAWSTPHASFRNQRRIRTFAGAAAE